jgi:hypothetical protein
VHPNRDPAELLGGVLGNRRSGTARFEGFRIREYSLQQRLIMSIGKRAEVDQMSFLDRAREVGVNLDFVKVGNDQDRRVFERFPVEVELVIGGFQVGATALVLPGKVPTIPDIGPAVASRVF